VSPKRDEKLNARAQQKFSPATLKQKRVKAKQKVAQARITSNKIINRASSTPLSTHRRSKNKTGVQRKTPEAPLQQKAAQVRRETKQKSSPT
jgi:hypothetical protein